VPTVTVGVVNIMLLLAALAAEVPAALVAVTVKVYVTLSANPETVIFPLAAVPVNPPGLEVAVYVVIGNPPSYVLAV
jgi:hypothetical protein